MGFLRCAKSPTICTLLAALRRFLDRDQGSDIFIDGVRFHWVLDIAGSAPAPTSETR
jgi:hypothetical protein